MPLDFVGAFVRMFMRLDGQKLALIVPFVYCGTGVQPLVTLQPDQPGIQRGGQRLGDLGLSDARRALQQQRPAQPHGQIDRDGQRVVGDIISLCQAVFKFLQLRILYLIFGSLLGGRSNGFILRQAQDEDSYYNLSTRASS
jgi:hypothetical protein